MPEKQRPPVNIYDYVNYRLFLRDKFTEIRLKNPHFSFRAFQKKAGTKSPSYLRMVIRGERNLADRGIEMLSNGFQLKDDERKFFGLLVRFNQADSPQEKERYFKEMSENKKFLKAKPLRSAQYNLFHHWYHVAILELVRLQTAEGEVKDEKWLHKNLLPYVGLVDVRRAVKDLLALGLLASEKGGNLERMDAMVATEDEVESMAVANLHVEMGRMAIEAARKADHRDREFGLLTIATSEKGFQKAKQQLRMMRETLHSTLEQEEGPKTIAAQINLQLFKLNTVRRSS